MKQFIAFAAVALTASSATVTSVPGAPYDLAWLVRPLSMCRLHCPDTSPAIISDGQFDGRTVMNPPRFYLADENTMAIRMEQNFGNRCELRHNDHFGVSSTEEASMSFRIKLEPTPETKFFNFGQIHTHDDKADGPFVMLRWQDSRQDKLNRIWASVRTDNPYAGEIKDKTSYDLGELPAGFFDLEISAFNNRLIITVNGAVKLDKDISYWSQVQNCYFKTGTYGFGDSVQATNVVLYRELAFVTPGHPQPEPSNDNETDEGTDPDMVPYELYVGSPDFHTFKKLNGATVSGDIYVRLAATPAEEALVEIVRFRVQGTDYLQKERMAPYDLAGSCGADCGFSLQGKTGTQVVTAEVTLKDGNQFTTTATFTVGSQLQSAQGRQRHPEGRFTSRNRWINGHLLAGAIGCAVVGVVLAGVALTVRRSRTVPNDLPLLEEA